MKSTSQSHSFFILGKLCFFILALQLLLEKALTFKHIPSDTLSSFLDISTVFNNQETEIILDIRESFQVIQVLTEGVEDCTYGQCRN